MSFFYVFLSGIIIGAAMVSPGVSGGVLAVILGVYDKMIYSLTNLFKNFKTNSLFIFCLATGVFLGAIFFSKILIFLYFKYELETKFMFLGFILGGISYLFKQIKLQLQKPSYFIIMGVIIVSFIFFKLSNINLDISSNITFLNMFLSGIIYSIGKIIPGVSGSFLLMLIGMYEYILNIIANPFGLGLGDIKSLLPFLLGLLIGVIVLLKLINYLLNKRFNVMYSIIIGFVISSVFVLFPNVTNILDLGKGILIFLPCFYLSYKFSN